MGGQSGPSDWGGNVDLRNQSRRARTALQTQRTGSAKDMRSGRAWCVQGIEKRPVWLECSEQGGKQWDEGGEVCLVPEWERRQFKVVQGRYAGGDGGTTPGDLRGLLIPLD